MGGETERLRAALLTIERKAREWAEADIDGCSAQFYELADLAGRATGRWPRSDLLRAEGLLRKIRESDPRW